MEDEIQKVMLETLDGIDNDDDYNDAKVESKKTVGGTIRDWWKKAWNFVSS